MTHLSIANSKLINWQLVMMSMSRIKVIKFRGRQIIFEDGNLGGLAGQMSAINRTIQKHSWKTKTCPKLLLKNSSSFAVF